MDPESSTQIIKLTQARQLLAECKTFDDAKKLYDLAEAARRYTVVSRLGQEAQNEATEIRLRAERLLGKMLGETIPHQGGRPEKNGRSGSTVFPEPKLSDIGVSKDQSSQWQKIAAIPDDSFEEFIDEHKEGKELTRTALLKHARELEQSEKREAQNQHAEEVFARDGSFITSIDDLVALVASGEQEPYGCIYADPPWAYDNQGTRASTNNHYDTMSVEALMKIPVAAVAAECSHLHLWTTNAFLRDAFGLIEAWGFEFKSSLVWVKSQMGIGNYWRVSHELLLLGVRGGQTALDRSLRSWIELPRTEHSAKPEAIRGMVQKLSPGPYLELFGRAFVDGWTVFGNECRKEL
jgi:N6-adenosine-specific RNA methylase IME4